MPKKVNKKSNAKQKKTPTKKSNKRQPPSSDSEIDDIPPNYAN